jgi:hypothetical protein
LPAIIDLTNAKCYRGGKCEQFIKSMFVPTKSNQRFINFTDTTSEFAMPMTTFNPNDMTKQQPILGTDLGGINQVYKQWPNFSSDPKKAKQQSDMFLKRLKMSIDQKQIKIEKPIDDKDPNFKKTK